MKNIYYKLIIHLNLLNTTNKEYDILRSKYNSCFYVDLKAARDIDH